MAQKKKGPTVRFLDWTDEGLVFEKRGPVDPAAQVEDFQRRIYAATTAAEFDALVDEIDKLALTDPHRVELLELAAMQRAMVLASPPEIAEEAEPAAEADTSRFTDWSPETLEIIPPPPGEETP